MDDSENLGGPDSSKTLSTESLQLSKVLIGQLVQEPKLSCLREDHHVDALTPPPIPCSGSGPDWETAVTNGSVYVRPHAEHQVPLLSHVQ